MRSLGAYRVDRSLTASLYMHVLMAYTAELIERGFHSVIFPGATRCRTNEVESQLKLGLLRTTSRARRGVLVVPVTINYQVVLEAETLIRYHLEGRAGERIVSDGRTGGLAHTLRRLFALDELAVVRFGEPIAPAGQPMRTVGDAIVTAYRRNTVLFATHLTARAIYDELSAGTDADVHALLAAPPGTLEVWCAEVHARIAAFIQRIRAHPEHGSIHPDVGARAADAIVADAIRVWTRGHARPVAHRRGDRLVVDDPSLVLFYRNRTRHAS
jgi:glycerol-3-phosphate O-acyltransferase